MARCSISIAFVLTCVSSMPFMVVSIQSSRRSLENSYASDPVPTDGANPPPRIGQWTPRDQKVSEEAIKDFQKFIKKNSVGRNGYASVVLIGDSTMAGVWTELSNITRRLHDSKFILHTGNDMPAPVYFSPDRSAVQPGGEWAETDPAILARHGGAKDAVAKAKAAHRILHKQGCTWGGHVETWMYPDFELTGLVVHMWSFLPDYAHGCWRACMKDAVKAFEPSAVLWNVGLHILNHKFDRPTCEKRQTPGEWNCGDYKEMITTATHDLLDASPVVIWKTTNFICEKKQIDHTPELQETFAKWQDKSWHASLEEECHQSCPLMANFTCSDWVMSEEATNRFYTESMEAIGKLQAKQPGRVRIVDTFEPSRKCCHSGCETETEDGEHYRGLDQSFMRSFAAALVEY